MAKLRVGSGQKKKLGYAQKWEKEKEMEWKRMNAEWENGFLCFQTKLATLLVSCICIIVVGIVVIVNASMQAHFFHFVGVLRNFIDLLRE